MSDQDNDLAAVIEGAEYPPLLNAVIPTLILVSSVAYAWSLQKVPNSAMNLLLLRPLFLGIWGFLLVVIVKDILPSIQAYSTRLSPVRPSSWRDRFAPGTEGGAGLIVAATFLYACFGPGDGALVYVISTFTYLAVVGYLIGDWRPVRILLQAATLAGLLYVIFGIALGVRL